MDEAETLGDRIAVLSHGQLLCCGSPGFLKSNLGQGLHLYILKTGESFFSLRYALISSGCCRMLYRCKIMSSLILAIICKTLAEL